MRVLIADDHAVVREGLKTLISQADGMSVSGEASNGRELLEQVAKGDFDAIVLDITMPELDGLDALVRLREQCPSVPVLVLSMHPEEQYATAALQAGADGYLTKESAPDALIEALRTVASGHKYLSQQLATILLDKVRTGKTGAPHEELSPRELQVLRMLATGMRGTEVAAQLTLSPKTVSTYRRRIMEKLEFASNVDLIQYANRHGLTGR